MEDKNTTEFLEEVKRQICHLTIKRDYLQHRINTEIVKESTNKRADAQLELNALQKKLDDLIAMETWLNETYS